MNTLDLSGPWTSEMYTEHLPEEVAFDEGLAKCVLDFCTPKKVLDLGCGLGYFVKYFRDKGIDAWGVEASDLGVSFQAPGYQIQQDISRSFDLKEKYDLAVCLEVVEHIPREFENIVFDNIVRHMSRYLLFSGATPGQQGTGHVNERQESYWFSHLVRRGLILRHCESINARLSSTLSWYTKNVSIWELVPIVLCDSNNLIADKDSHIMSCEVLLQNNQIKLEKAIENASQLQAQLQQTQAELQQNQTELQRARAIITSMQTSKFWKLRTKWFNLKKITM